MNELQVEYSCCPLCRSESVLLGVANCDKHSLWHDDLPATLDWMRCTHCGHVYTRHYWSEAGIAEVFRNAHANQLADGDSPDTKRAIWSQVVTRVVSLLGGYGQAFAHLHAPVWVDVGCGDGALTLTAADFGFEAIGLDMRAETVARIKKLGFRAQYGDFMKMRFEGQVDVLSMMDVLEHMPFPRQAIEKAGEVLKAGGVLLISLPDLNSSSWAIMDAAKTNPYWAEIEHHHNFSRKRLITLLDESGFDVVDFAIPYRYKAQMEVYARKRKV